MWQDVMRVIGGIMPTKLAKMIIALGSNQPSVAGTPEVTLRQAVQSLEKRGGVIRKLSTFYQTPCFPAGVGPDYVNAALLLEAEWTPSEAMNNLHAVEQEFGRERVQRWGQRTLDLDLIAFDDVVAPNLETYEVWRDLAPDVQKIRAPTDLILPHPRVQDRAFVLVPMLDVADDWVHPVTGLSIQLMLDGISDSEISQVIPLKL
jgi:2-amino-4-hydroxy-6-hydroxymethyldihydropteridine diphosphokinase